jgi:hypothetical protein
MNLITVFLSVACLAAGAGLGATGNLYSGAAVVIVAIVIASALKMANAWQKFVILRAGKLRGTELVINALKPWRPSFAPYALDRW